MLVNVISLIISIISFGLMILLWHLQDKEAKESKKILKNTQSLAKKLETDSEFNKKVIAFFKIKDKKVKKGYKVIYPAKYSGRPLPLIHQGDFYAIHIVSLALGLRNLKLIDIKKITQNCKNENNNTCRECEGNIIYICSPQSNPCLDYKYPFANKVENECAQYISKAQYPIEECCKKENLRFTYKYDYQSEKWLDEIQLPCWFINHIKYSDIEERCISVKKIQTSPRKKGGGFQSPLKSPADIFYEKAEKNPDEVIEPGTVSDIGILARLSSKEGIDIIISGIHQYGTWIVADFLNCLLRGKKLSVQEGKKELILGDNDFVAIIEGFFDSSKLHVNRDDIKIKELWIRDKGNNWKSFDDLKKEYNLVA